MNKTGIEFLLIGTKQQLAKVNVDHVKVGNADIVPHSPVKNLGVWLNSNLSVVEHIPKACSAAFFHIYITFAELENIFPGKSRKP